MNPEPENLDGTQTSASNPFPQPQTIPAGWDVSGFSPASEPVSGMGQTVPVES